MAGRYYPGQGNRCGLATFLTRGWLCRPEPHVLNISKHAGDLLRIEHSRTEVRVNPPELEGPHSILGTAVAQREAGEPSIAPQAQHAADAATTPWRIDVSPCHQDSTGLGREGAESEGKETEQFMVLYNVAARTELHVR